MRVESAEGGDRTCAEETGLGVSQKWGVTASGVCRMVQLSNCSNAAAALSASAAGEGGPYAPREDFDDAESRRGRRNSDPDTDCSG
jgi:hypothetical protein